MSELMTVKDVAEVLKVAEDTVVRRFAKAKGVIDLGVGETRHKRRYRILRIPKEVVEKHLAELGGRAISIEVPRTSGTQAKISAVGRPGNSESREGRSSERHNCSRQSDLSSHCRTSAVVDVCPAEPME